MKKCSFFLSAVLLGGISLAFFACESNNTAEIASFERIHPDLSAIIDSDAKTAVIAEGFDWTEGPLWVEKQQMLLFSDIPQNSVFKWTAAKGKELYLKPCGYTGSASRGGETGSNGLTLDPKGQLVLCQHGDRRLAYMNAPVERPKADFVTIADNYQGKRFDSPNDAMYSSKGDLYFTDPPYGLEKNASDPLKEAPYQGVYRVRPGGEVTLLTTAVHRPNGLAFLPGERTLLVASSDSTKAVWYQFELNDQDSLVNQRIFYDATAEAHKMEGLPDGLKVDKNGNVFASGPGGIWIFNKAGVVLGKIRISGPVSNCAFADDEKTLFITADMRVLKVTLRK